MGLLFGGSETRTSPGSFPPPPIPPFYGADAGGMVNVDSKPDVALQIPAVWACVSLLANTVSSLPLNQFKQPPANKPNAVAQRIPNSTLMLEPDTGQTQSEWLHMVMVSLQMRGNAYGIITGRDWLGLPTGVHLVNPDSVTVKVNDKTGEVEYHWANRGSQRDTLIPRDTIWHCKGLTLPGALVGLSPISYAAALLGMDLSAREFAAGFYQGGGVPKAIIKSDQQVNQETARTIKDRVMAAIRGREPAVLGMGLDYQMIQVKPEESQFLKTQEFNVQQICRFFGVPASMVDGSTGHAMTYTNVEQRGIDFLTYHLGHWLKRIEDSLYPLLPGRQFVRFDPSALMRLDAATQAKVDLERIAGKIVAPSELRARDGLDPMTDEQKREIAMVPVEVSPLGRPAGSAQLLTPVTDSGAPPASEDPTGA